MRPYLNLIFNLLGAYDDFTVAAWVYPDVIQAPGGQVSSAVVLGNANNFNWVRINSGVVSVKADGSTWEVDTATGFVVGEWQHLALVRKGGLLSVYRNGVFEGAKLVHQKALVLNRIGSKNGVQFFDGRLDNVRIYEGVGLSHDEVLGLAGRSAHWRMDEVAAGPVVDRLGVLDGLNVGASINQSGKLGGAYDFDGSDEVELSYSLEVGGSDSFMISAYS